MSISISALNTKMYWLGMSPTTLLNFEDEYTQCKKQYIKNRLEFLKIKAIFDYINKKCKPAYP